MPYNTLNYNKHTAGAYHYSNPDEDGPGREQLIRERKQRRPFIFDPCKDNHHRACRSEYDGVYCQCSCHLPEPAKRKEPLL